MKRLLMLAYFFPPSKAAGTFRTLRFVRDLPACGWAPRVLTVHERTYVQSELDPALLHKVPDTTPVIRAAAPPYHRWYKRAVEAAKALRRGLAPRRAVPGDGGGAGAAPVHETTRLTIRSPLDLVYMLCRTPDIDAGWYLPALLRGLCAVVRDRPQVLYATGGPWTTFLVARDLARLARLPLVLDYRDPWTSNPAVARSGTWFDALALRLERTVVRQASCIVANTDVLREALVQSHGEAVAAKTVVIHNSFDPSDYAGPDPRPEDIFTMSYVGAMYDAHSPEPLLQAVAQLCRTHPDIRGRLRIRLVGAGAARIGARAGALGLDGIVQVQEPVPHAEAVRLQRAAHVLLLFLTVPSDRSTFVPSKLFEYMAARRPIFAVTGGGALDRLLRARHLTPWIYRPENLAGMGQGILNLLERHARGVLPRLSDAIVNEFSGAAAAQALATLLEAAAAGTPPRAMVAPVRGAAPAPEVVEAR
jgi:glycosyltransferase involved in cell wall biosynthesis